jgi:diadenosine tetraphosphate (Ap4A) HIT family hydrolase
VSRHEPPNYGCPFCAVVAGRESDVNARADVVFRDAQTTALISPKWWDAAPGHVIVVPNEHVENVYEIDDDLLASVYRTPKRLACALKQAHGCEARRCGSTTNPVLGRTCGTSTYMFFREPSTTGSTNEMLKRGG